MIWQRTLASQMADAAGTTVSVRLGAAVDRDDGDRLPSSRAVGTTITFPGYRAGVRRVAPTRATATATSARRCCRRSPSATRSPVDVARRRNGHTTSPPARYTEASLVKRLEELGIGRPSTWASIIQTIQDRGYVWKKGQALVPTWTAFAVVGLLEQHFDELVDYAFTGAIEEDLDAIARNERQKKDEWLSASTSATRTTTLPGLKRLVEENLDEIDAAEINTFPLGLDPDGDEIVVKPGKYGPYVKRGDDTASVPEDLAPDELTVDEALELLAAAEERRADRRARRLPGVRQERPLRARTCSGATPDNLPPGPRQAEDGEPVQDDDARADHGRRRRGAAAAAAHARRRSGRRRGRSSPTTAATARTCRRARTSATSTSEEQLLTITLDAGAGDLRAAEGASTRGGPQHGGQGSAARVRHRPGERQAGRRQGRQVRRVRHRRRDERLARQGRPARGDAARAGVRTARDPPRAGGGEGRRPSEEVGRTEVDRQEGSGQEEVGRQEDGGGTQAG